jgi:phage terminase large subunit-like protein
LSTSNVNWYYAGAPTDLIPATDDPHGNGSRFLRIARQFPMTQGAVAGKRFGDVILPWQERMILKVKGDTDADGRPLIREVGWKIGKGSGKTVMLSIFAVASVIDWASRGINVGFQVVIVAANVASADLSFRHVREAIAFDEYLRKNFHSNLSKREVTYKPTGVTIKVIAPELENAVGLRPALVLADELHAAAITSKDFSAVIDQLKRGGQNTDEFLLIGATTAAVARPEGYYREWLNRLRAIRDGTLHDPTVLPLLFEFPGPHLRPDLSIDSKDEWWRAMPSLRTASNPLGTMDIAALEKELEDAVADSHINGTGSMELLLSQRLGLEAAERGGNSGITPLARYWEANRNPVAQPPSGASLYVGIDPSAGLSDPFAVVTVWKEGDVHRCQSRQFLTQQGHDEANKNLRKIYAEAIACGELSLHDSTFEMEAAAMAHCLRIAQHSWGVHFCGDASGLAGFRERFERSVAAYTPIDQGWKLMQALEFAGGLAHDGLLHHGGQPLLSANVQNVVIENNRMKKYDVGTSGVGHAKIDGLMAMLSALMFSATQREFDCAAMIG